jgi:hypothetical protein
MTRFGRRAIAAELPMGDAGSGDCASHAIPNAAVEFCG